MQPGVVSRLSKRALQRDGAVIPLDGTAQPIDQADDSDLAASLAATLVYLAKPGTEFTIRVSNRFFARVSNYLSL